MLDGHVSHYQPELLRLGAKDIILFCLPPHCTHLAQPFDEGAFSPLKVNWRQECARFMENNPGELDTKWNFSATFPKHGTKQWHRKPLQLVFVLLEYTLLTEKPLTFLNLPVTIWTQIWFHTFHFIAQLRNDVLHVQVLQLLHKSSPNRSRNSFIPDGKMGMI